MMKRARTNTSNVRIISEVRDDLRLINHLDETISALKSLKLAHITYTNTDDMISYHINRAIEYCNRLKDETYKRINGNED